MGAYVNSSLGSGEKVIYEAHFSKVMSINHWNIYVYSRPYSSMDH